MSKFYRFNEPHFTGGNATVDITEKQILEFMKKWQKNNLKAKDATDQELIDEFCINYGAWKEKGE